MTKPIRQAIVEGGTEKRIRPKIGRNLKLDATEYQRRHPGMKLMWIPDYGSDLHEWIAAGAQPVPELDENTTIYPGINDNKKDGWVTRHGGIDTNSGKPYLMYLLMIDPALYDEMKIEPELERQQEIEKAMRLGANASDLSAHLPGGGGIQTYAPNLPDGSGQGFNQIRSTK